MTSFSRLVKKRGVCGNYIDMSLLLPFKALLVSFVRFLKGGFAQKLADRAETTVRRIGAIERDEVVAPSAEVEQILTAMDCSKAEVVIMSACLEAP